MPTCQNEGLILNWKVNVKVSIILSAEIITLSWQYDLSENNVNDRYISGYVSCQSRR